MSYTFAGMENTLERNIYVAETYRNNIVKSVTLFMDQYVRSVKAGMNPVSVEYEITADGFGSESSKINFKPYPMDGESQDSHS